MGRTYNWETLNSENYEVLIQNFGWYPKNEPKIQVFVKLRNHNMDSAVLCYTSLVMSYYMCLFQLKC